MIKIYKNNKDFYLFIYFNEFHKVLFFIYPILKSTIFS